MNEQNKIKNLLFFQINVVFFWNTTARLWSFHFHNNNFLSFQTAYWITVYVYNIENILHGGYFVWWFNTRKFIYKRHIVSIKVCIIKFIHVLSAIKGKCSGFVTTTLYLYTKVAYKNVIVFNYMQRDWTYFSHQFFSEFYFVINIRKERWNIQFSIQHQKSSKVLYSSVQHSRLDKGVHSRNKKKLNQQMSEYDLYTYFDTKYIKKKSNNYLKLNEKIFELHSLQNSFQFGNIVRICVISTPARETNQDIFFKLTRKNEVLIFTRGRMRGCQQE